MRMKALIVTIRPLSAFGTPLSGDTLFGQLCWALALRKGGGVFEELLRGYTIGKPFAVVSDGLPHGYLPRATVPDSILAIDDLDPQQRKALKRKQWLPVGGLGSPYRSWLSDATDAWPGSTATVTQNTIHRITGTTGSGIFAPRQVEQISFPKQTLLDIHVVINTERLSEPDLNQAFGDIGQSGFGRDASSGLGKFEVISTVAKEILESRSADFMTLAPCAPDVGDLDPSGCWTLPITRFGRHGGVIAVGGQPFKRPILFAKTGAVLRLRSGSRLFHGTGIGGRDKPISAAMPGTVHQGYAPIVPIHLDAKP
jgi:CRISPR-associated protein Csm4